MSKIDGSSQKLVAVDFDGTLCRSKYPECGPMIKGAKDALVRLRELGYLILIYSCRSSHWHYNLFGGEGIPVLKRPTVEKMKKWLIEHDIPFDEIDDGSKGKPLAEFYLDDRAVRVDNNWDEVISFIESKQ
jgi:hypothetical protein